jgi:hypothetical protein
MPREATVPPVSRFFAETAGLLRFGRSTRWKCIGHFPAASPFLGTADSEHGESGTPPPGSPSVRPGVSGGP